MSVHVLLNLLNELGKRDKMRGFRAFFFFFPLVLFKLLNQLGKRDKMRGLPRVLSLFCKKFNKFNNTRARMLEFIDYMTLRLLLNLISAVKTL